MDKNHQDNDIFTIESVPAKKKTGQINWFLYLTASTASLTMLVAGIAMGFTSPLLPKLNDNVNPIGRPIETSEQSWITASMPLGAICGCLVAGRLADKIGRKKGLLVIAIPMVISLVTIAFAKLVPLFYAAQFLMGISSGSVFTILPMYLGEVAEDFNRGTVSALSGVFLTGGVLFSLAIGPFLTIQNFSLVCITPLLFFFPVFLIWIPESPQFYALINDQERMKTSLEKLRNNDKLEEEVSILMKSIEQKKKRSGFKKIVTVKPTRHAFIIIMGLVILQQCSGISAIFAYMQTIFQASGSEIGPEISSIIVGVVQIFATIITSLVVDKLGRRVLLLGSSIGSLLSLVVLGTYFYLKENDFDVDILFWIPITSLLVYIVSFSLGLGPLTWTVLSEIFPPEVKGVASSAATTVRFLANFLVVLFFPAFSLLLGNSFTLWVFALICLLGGVFIFWVLPETKGKSLQEIQNLLEGRTR